ncbi:MAG: tryptophan synthase subunit alpha [Chloroflexota bacterium]
MTIAARVRGPRAVRAAFASAWADRRAAFVVYLMAGFPSEEGALACAVAALEAGADVLEIGVPFSDPLADGPVVAEAGRVALAAGGAIGAAARLAAALRARGHDQPLLAMSYLNPLAAAGEAATLAALTAAGADGMIVPDLPAGESPRFERLAAAHDLSLTFLVAPNSAPARVDAAVRASTGFLYVVPLFGVTGARSQLAVGAAELLDRMRVAAAGRAPVAAGFGISTAAQMRVLEPHADGLIVGSAIVAAARDGGAAAVGDLVTALRG